MTDHWLQDIKTRLATYEHPVPNGLWELVEHELRKQKPP